MELKERFWKYVNKDGPIHPVYGQCWVWVGCKAGDGYGGFELDSHLVGSHRVSWMITNGEIPKNLHVLHKCDNKLCVNPSHLFLGTHQDNMRDMVSKKRQAFTRGEKSGNAKLTEYDVRLIRELYTKRSKNFGCVGLSEMFGVSPITISRVVCKTRYACVSD